MTRQIKRVRSRTTGKLTGQYTLQYKNAAGRNTSFTGPRKKVEEFAASLVLDGPPAMGHHEAKGVLFSDAMQRYLDTELVGKKANPWTRNCVKRLMSYDIAKVELLSLNVRHANHHIMKREKQVGPNAIIREFTVLKVILGLCEKWYGLEYPWSRLKMPKAAPARNRMITDEEVAALVAAVGLDLNSNEVIEHGSQRAVAAFLIACDNGMRQGEIAGMRFEMINFTDDIILIPKWLSKTDVARPAMILPITRKILRKLAYRAGNDKDLVLGMSAGTIGTTFRRVYKRTFTGLDVDVEPFTFHDSRHRAVTVLSQLLGILDLAETIGHSNINELQTYYEADGAMIAASLKRNLRKQAREQA